MKNFIFLTISSILSTNLFATSIYTGISAQFENQLIHELPRTYIENTEYITFDDYLINTTSLENKSVYEWSTFWPSGIIYYEPAPNVNSAFLYAFENACKIVGEKVKISCVRRTNQENYVYLYSGNFNRAEVGMIGGKQIMEIFDWHKTYIIAHEIIHALGFGHEQNRSDRDDYVTIMWQNLDPEMYINFQKSKSLPTSPYDYYSVMHYSSSDYSINGQETIVPKNPNVNIGQRSELSRYDVYDLAQIYGWK